MPTMGSGSNSSMHSPSYGHGEPTPPGGSHNFSVNWIHNSSGTGPGAGDCVEIKGGGVYRAPFAGELTVQGEAPINVRTGEKIQKGGRLCASASAMRL
jgi:hypothetical protein